MQQASQVKTVFRHTFVYSMATLLQKAVGFLMMPVYAHFLGAEGYGVIGMIDIVISFMSVIVGFGITSSLQRFYFEKETEEERRTLISTGMIVTVITVIVVCVPALLLCKPLAYLALGQIAGGWYFLVIAILTFMADMTAMSASSYILIKQHSKLYISLSLFRFFLGLALNICFIVILRMGIVGLLYSNLASAIIYSIIVHAYTVRQVGTGFNRQDARAILKYSLPLVPGYFSMLVRNDADKVILRSLAGLSQLGTYMMLMNFSSLITILVLQPFQNIWNVKQFEICDSEDGPGAMAKVYTMQLAIMLFVGLILSLETPLLIKMIAPREFWVPGIFAALAVLSRILFASYYNMVFGLSYAKLTGKISLIQFISSIVSVVLNLIFIKYLSIFGALISTCLVYFLQCVIAYRMSSKYYRIPFEWRKISLLCGIAVGLYLGISSVNLSGLGHGDWTQAVSGYSNSLIDQLHSNFILLDKVKSHLRHVSSDIVTVIEGFVKLLMSLTFIMGLIVLKIVTAREVVNPFITLFYRLGIKTTRT